MEQIKKLATRINDYKWFWSLITSVVCTTRQKFPQCESYEEIQRAGLAVIDVGVDRVGSRWLVCLTAGKSAESARLGNGIGTMEPCWVLANLKNCLGEPNVVATHPTWKRGKVIITVCDYEILLTQTF